MLLKAPKIEFWHKSKIKRGSNIRKSRDQEELRRLGESYKRRWIMPLLALEDGTLIDGEGRFLGGCMAGMEEFPVQVVDRVLSAIEIAETQLLSVLQRTDPADYDKAAAMRDMQQAHPEMTGKQLAEQVLHIDPTNLCRYLSVFTCIAPIIEAARLGELGVAKWYTLSKLPPEQQPEGLALALHGASRDELESRGRKARNGEKPAVRVSRVKWVLPSGVSGTLSSVGEGMTLEDVIEALASLMKEAEKALKDKLDAKTWSAVLRDKAKAVG
jgi:hypothetical protein